MASRVHQFVVEQVAGMAGDPTQLRQPAAVQHELAHGDVATRELRPILRDWLVVVDEPAVGEAVCDDRREPFDASRASHRSTVPTAAAATVRRATPDVDDGNAVLVHAQSTATAIGPSKAGRTWSERGRTADQKPLDGHRYRNVLADRPFRNRRNIFTWLSKSFASRLVNGADIISATLIGIDDTVTARAWLKVSNPNLPW